jgi:hypothetical protein
LLPPLFLLFELQAEPAQAGMKELQAQHVFNQISGCVDYVTQVE